MPETLAAVQWGGLDNLQRAARNGECEVLQDGNLRFYKWRELKGGRQWNKTETLTSSQYEAVTDDAKFTAVTKQLRSMKWDFKLSDAEEKKW